MKAPSTRRLSPHTQHSLPKGSTTTLLQRELITWNPSPSPPLDPSGVHPLRNGLAHPLDLAAASVQRPPTASRPHKDDGRVRGADAVSYTHLTLPTIYSV